MTIAQATYADAPDAAGKSYVVDAVIDGAQMHGIDLRVHTFWSERVLGWMAEGNVPSPYVEPPAPAPRLGFIEFMALFTPAEQAAIVNSGDTQVKLFLLQATGAGEIGLGDALTMRAVNYLASLNLIAPPRVAQILANQPPS